MLIRLLAFAFLGLSSANASPLRVVATIPDLAELVRVAGGPEVEVESIAKGTQDYHFIEAKPSFMVKMSRADLVVSCGLDLEVGWLPLVVRGSRNPKIQAGSSGFFELGPLVGPIEVAKGKVTRAEGDVHPDGNPHFYLDPVRMGIAALKIAEKLGQMRPEQAKAFLERAKAYQKRLEENTALWKARVLKSGVRSIVTYHKGMSYFLDRFGIQNPIVLEPKPGVPPTSGHVLSLIETMKSQKISLIFVENYFDPSITKRITEQLKDVRVRVVPVAVGGAPGVDTFEKLMETLISNLEDKGKS